MRLTGNSFEEPLIKLFLYTEELLGLLTQHVLSFIIKFMSFYRFHLIAVQSTLQAVVTSDSVQTITWSPTTD